MSGNSDFSRSSNMLRQAAPSLVKPNDQLWQKVTLLLQTLGMKLHLPVERSEIQRNLTLTSPEEWKQGDAGECLALWLMRTAQSIRLRLAPVTLKPAEAWNLIADGFTVVAVDFNLPLQPWTIFEAVRGRTIQATELTDEIHPRIAGYADLAKAVASDSSKMIFLAENVFQVGDASKTQADSASANRHDAHHGVHESHSQLPPHRRFARLMFRETSDVFTILVFSFVSVILSLATPLTVEVLVNTIGFGRNFQPILVLSLVLMGVLFLSSAFKFLQIVVVELLQRRLFVRLVGDLAYRLPNVNRQALQGIHGPELLNRYFDIMTIQKGTAFLLLEGVTIVMQTLIGTLLLAFYHPYLLGFDVLLILCMTVVTFFLGRAGVKTALEESVVKYSVASWLQDVIACPSAFKLHGGSELGTDRTHRLTVEYLAARRKHFFVLVRQTIFALFLMVISLTALYALGGYLVINGRLTLGQLVAAELVVGVIVGAFAKSSKLIEAFYDLMSAMDKVGYLLDLPVDPANVQVDSEMGPVAVKAQNIQLHDPATHRSIEVGSFEVGAGESIAVVGSVGAADSLVLPAIAGLIQPSHGFIEIAGLDARDAIRFSDGRIIGYAGPEEFFQGTIAENLRLGRSGITDIELRKALELVELWNELLPLPDGLESRVQTGGFPLGEDQRPRLMIARAIVGTPRLVLIDWLLDRLPHAIRYRIWDRLRSPEKPWTLIVTTHDSKIIEQADKDFRLEDKHPS
jgi:putative ABC transport system ATP-binding protein